MKKNIKKLWVKALRSGKYKQGCRALRYDNMFCCLGVLCDLHRKRTKKKGNIWRNNAYLGYRAGIPEDVQKWAGLNSDNPMVGVLPLAEYNDDLNNGMPKNNFKKIAKLIEENF